MCFRTTALLLIESNDSLTDQLIYQGAHSLPCLMFISNGSE